MGNRREPRVQLDISVKVCGMDMAGHPFVQTAYAVSVSRTGVRLTGVGPLVRVGTVVVVIYKQKKARFRVAWIGEIGQPEAGHAGLEAAASNEMIWDFALPYPGKDGFVDPDEERGTPFSTPPAARGTPSPGTAAAAALGPIQQAAPGGERRIAPRFKCRGSATIFVPNISFPTRGQIDDLSLSGVYINTNAPLPVGSAVTLQLALQESTFKADAEVRTSHPGVGMGLMFTGIDTENRMIIGAIINRLSGAMAAPAAQATAFQAVPPATVAPSGLTAAPRWDVVGREISEWFRTHENLSREDFFGLMRRQ